MAVHANEERLKIDTVAFEARYEEGYRYLDRCGETIVQIQRHDRSWIVNSVNPNNGQLRNEDRNMTMVLGNVGVSFNLLKGAIDLRDAEAKVEAYAREAEALYDIATRTIGVSETTRVGVRFKFRADADTLEEADRFICRGMESPLRSEVERVTRSTLRDVAVAYIVEDSETGYRRRIELASQVIQKVGDPLYTGLGAETGTGTVTVDIDTFTRPEQGHFERSSMFIQSSYIRARSIALETFQWLRRQQAPRTR